MLRSLRLLGVARINAYVRCCGLWSCLWCCLRYWLLWCCMLHHVTRASFRSFPLGLLWLFLLWPLLLSWLLLYLLLYLACAERPLTGAGRRLVCFGLLLSW